MRFMRLGIKGEVFSDEDNLEVNVLEIKSGKNIKSKSLDLVKEKKDISLKTVSLLNELNDKYIPLYLFSYMINHQ